MKIAVVGSGISGLACAYQLARGGHEVALLEANDYFGGHTNTVDVTLDGKQCGVDTGFLVFNNQTYPNLVRLFQELEVRTVSTDMSFSVKMPFGKRTLEWAGSNLDTVFAQRGNLLRPRFLRMLADILRFNREASRLAFSGTPELQVQSLGSFLEQRRFGAEFRDWYLLPMAASIWSCPVRQMLDFPVASFVRFCANHGLLQVTDRPQWQTVTGGARKYVDKLLAEIPRKHLSLPVISVTRIGSGNGIQVRVAAPGFCEHFDHVVLATHSDQSQHLLQDADAHERSVLGAIRYQPNRAVLHTDSRCLPKNRKTWSAWNYQSAGGDAPQVCVHYLLNKLQPLPFSTPLIVSLNPISAPESVIASFDYAHPVFDAAAIEAQRRLPSIQGKRNVWFAGAWTGYGFHEDGLKSGLAVARAIARLPLAEPFELAAA